MQIKIYAHLNFMVVYGKALDAGMKESAAHNLAGMLTGVPLVLEVDDDGTVMSCKADDSFKTGEINDY